MDDNLVRSGSLLTLHLSLSLNFFFFFVCQILILPSRGTPNSFCAFCSQTQLIILPIFNFHFQFFYYFFFPFIFHILSLAPFAHPPHSTCGNLDRPQPERILSIDKVQC